MDKIWLYYYSLLILILLGAIAYYLISSIAHDASIREHFIGVNNTISNGTCKITWLGGWDFDAFYTNVSVNGKNVGHPKPMTVIFNETCRNLSVMMYDKAVKTDIELYRYNVSGES